MNGGNIVGRRGHMGDTEQNGAAAERAKADLIGAAPRPRLYLRIAVTGHRGPPRLDADVVRPGIARAYDICADMLRQQHEGQSGFYSGARAELGLVSALAEGADQIAVDVFTARANPTWLASRVEAVIPFDIDGYAATIVDQAAAARMREMASRADARLMLSDGSPDCTAAGPDDHEKHWRAQRYAAVGDILVCQADVLIAVWNGVASTELGGTGWVISSALREGTPVLWVHSLTGAVRLLAPGSRYGDLMGEAAKAQGSLPAESPEAVVRLHGAINPLLAPAFDEIAGPGENHFDGYASSRRSYNSFFDAGGDGRSPMRRTWATAYSRLLWLTGAYVAREAPHGAGAASQASTQHHQRGWPSDRWPGWTIDCVNMPKPLHQISGESSEANRLRDSIARPWASFDTIATRLGHIYRSSYVLTFLFAAITVLLALTGQFVHSHQPIVTILEWTSLAIAGASFVLSRYFKVHDRWVIARDIEGQLRAGWNLAQLGLGGRRALKRKSFPWPAWAVQGWVGFVGVPDAQTTPAYLAQLAEHMREAAVADQIGYHRSNAERLHMLHHTLELAGKVAFVLTPWAGLFAFLHHFEVSWAPHVSHEIVVLFGAGMPAIAAAVAGLRYQGDFLRFATRSHRTAEDLERVETALKGFVARMEDPLIAAGDKRNAFVELRDILLELEAVLIADLQDWRYVYSARPNPEP